MKASKQFLFLTFVIIVAVLFTASNLTEAVLAISLLTNFFVISTHFTNLLGEEAAPSVPAAAIVPTAAPASKPAEIPAEKPAPAPEDMYGPFYNAWDAYRVSTDPAPEPRIAVSAAERAPNIDSANALIAQQRARDKRCVDGGIVKDVNYYRYHFGPELDREAVKEWWGAGEL